MTQDMQVYFRYWRKHWLSYLSLIGVIVYTGALFPLSVSGSIALVVGIVSGLLVERTK